MAKVMGLVTKRSMVRKRPVARVAREKVMVTRLGGKEEGNGKVARAMATATRVVDNKEGDGEDDKGNVNNDNLGNGDGGQ
jgi:hypothetical protein